MRSSSTNQSKSHVVSLSKLQLDLKNQIHQMKNHMPDTGNLDSNTDTMVSPHVQDSVNGINPLVTP